MKSGSILIDFVVNFTMQFSEFIKSVNSGSNLKTKLHEKEKKVHFSPEN